MSKCVCVDARQPENVALGADAARALSRALDALVAHAANPLRWALLVAGAAREFAAVASRHAGLEAVCAEVAPACVARAVLVLSSQCSRRPIPMDRRLAS